MPASSSEGAGPFSIRRVSVLLVGALLMSGVAGTRAAGAASQISFLPVASFPGVGVLPTADLDGDGKLDLIVAGAGILSLRYGNGDGSFSPPVDYSLGEGLNGTVAADFNHDGALDLAIANISTNQLLVLINRGHRTFAPAVQYAVGDGPTGVAAADFNGDGRTDLAVSNHRSSNLCVLLNRGDGTFLPAVFYPGGDHPGAMITADFNGDGKADLAMANIVGSSVLLYFGNGSGKFTVGDNYPVGQYSGQLVAGDFNRDGKLDLVTTNWMGSSMSVLFGDGRGKFRAAEFYPANSYPGMVAAADLDGDGDLDLAFSNGGTGYFTVLQNNGSGQFLPPVTFDSGGSDARSLTVGDFNRDGRPDVAVGNSSTATILVLLNTTPASSPTGPSPPPQSASPPVYDASNGHWYQEVEAPGGIVWQGANAAAQATAFMGLTGHLATITSGEENQFILNNLPHALQGHWWLGGYQDTTAAGTREPAGGWRWVTGEPWAFTNWEVAEPDNVNGSEDRLHLLNDGRWNDAAGSYSLGGYVVEYDTPAAYGAPAVAMVEIIPAPVSGGLLTTGQVTLTAPAGPGGMTVTLSSSNPAVAAPVVERIVISAGSMSSTFKIRTTRRTSAAYLTISATANSITRSRELTVYP
jgi:hypothetical protein